MATYTAGVNKALNSVLSAAEWNQYMGAGGNMDILGAYTSGSVLFGGAAGIISQDNANFFWDNTNDRLGIRVSPSFTLHVVGAGADDGVPAVRITRHASVSFTSTNTDYRSQFGFLSAGGEPYFAWHAEHSTTSNQWRNDNSTKAGCVMFHDELSTPSLVFKWNGVATANADFSSTVDALSIRSDGLITMDKVSIEKLTVTQTATTGFGVNISRNLAAASTDNAIVYITNNNTGDDQSCLHVNTSITNAITGGNIVIRYNSIDRIGFGAHGSGTFIDMFDWDNGTTGTGSELRAGRNSSTPSAGTVNFVQKDGVKGMVWQDSTGNLRTGADHLSDTDGVVIGNQTSQLSKKNILHLWSDPFPALKAILETPVVDFVYRNGAYNQTKFTGIVSEWSPEFTMDQNKVFNPVSAFGYTVEAIKALCERIQRIRRIQNGRSE